MPDLHSLISRFHNDPRRASATYNETEARVQYINPLFELLGWDMRNRAGRGEVKHEDKVTIRDKAKAPDYGFYLDGRRRFFVEAKKPAVNIGQQAGPAYQLRRYAWTAKLPLSVLTDFEEFAVYDTRVRPEQGDKADAARIGYWTYGQYPDAWDEIAAIFSREAVLGGSLEQFAEARGKRGVAPVDAELLREIERWRELLARNIARRNPGLTERDLNFAVQQTIDRLLFLRIAEDRGIEPYGRLKDLLGAGDVYSRLFLLFNQADARYNSGLFHFAPERGRGDPDYLTPRLNIDDKALHDIIRNLYEPVSPYEFSVFPADILGQVYEQFLGKVIRLSGKSAKVEEKPEVRKAGGVYYTPTYIVEYIVAQTVGKLLEGHTPDPTGPVSRLRVLDPACGSGSFLLGAYQYLLDWHLRGYLAAPSKWSRGRGRTLHQTAAGEYHLTLAERKRILLDNLYGVDIDPQAVEVTKLSLLLKVLEDSPDALTGQMALLPERVLPDLGENIKCGNSLIGPDFYDGAQATLFDMGEQLRINAFDWRAEFREIMDAGGFDVVIGNPPYIRIQTMKEWAPAEVEFYKRQYRAAGKGNYDIYVVFVERGLELLNSRGRLGYILPHKFFNAKYGEPLREVIAEGRHLSGIVHFGDQQVFSGATTYTCLMFLDKSGKDEFRFVDARDLDAWRLDESAVEGMISDNKVTGKEWNFSVQPGAALFERLAQFPHTLADFATRMYQGSITSADTVYLFKEFGPEVDGLIRVFSKELGKEVLLESRLLKRVVRSGDVKRYYAMPSALVLFPYHVESGNATLYSPKELERLAPYAWEYLKANRKLLEAREKGKFKDSQWYRFGRSQNLGLWEQSKLMVPYMITNLAAYYDVDDDYYFINVTTGGYGITVDETKISYLYLCGLLNSRLLDFFLKQVSTNFRGGYMAANKQYIEQLPIRTIDPTNPTDAAAHSQLVTLVQHMLELHRRHAAEANPQVRTVLQRQIDATDRQIDRLVYGLYGLTEEEIGVVEGG